MPTIADWDEHFKTLSIEELEKNIQAIDSMDEMIVEELGLSLIRALLTYVYTLKHEEMRQADNDRLAELVERGEIPDPGDVYDRSP